jgi:hypothetical protein
MSYPNQPDNCPEPKGQCPMHSPEFISRLEKIENEMRESRKYRHERNEAYSNVLNEIRVSIMDHDEELKELRGMHKEVIDALRGVMGRTGLIKETANLEVRVESLEIWKRDIKAFMAGALAICSVVSAVLSTLIGYIVHYMKT